MADYDVTSTMCFWRLIGSNSLSTVLMRIARGYCCRFAVPSAPCVPADAPCPDAGQPEPMQTDLESIGATPFVTGRAHGIARPASRVLGFPAPASLRCSTRAWTRACVRAVFRTDPATHARRLAISRLFACLAPRYVRLRGLRGLRGGPRRRLLVHTDDDGVSASQSASRPATHPHHSIFERSDSWLSGVAQR